MRIIFFGDIVGKIGRQALAKILPDLKKEFKPDLIFANGENLAHGKGVTPSIVQEIIRFGIDYLTSGNHFWDKREYREVIKQKLPILRPANYPDSYLGQGYVVIKTNFGDLLLVNLIGRVFIRNFQVKAYLKCPFKKFDQIYSRYHNRVKFTIVDFHAEATAEKIAFGYYLNGRASAVLGTHTHIQTADEKILADGTAYLTDLGMIGAKDSVIGVNKELIIELIVNPRKKTLLKKLRKEYIPERGQVIVNGVFLELDDKTGKAKKIERINRETIV